MSYFPAFDDGIHDDYDQYKRMLNAKTIRDSDVYIEAISQSAIIRGSKGDTYNVTLDGCTCRDFTVRKLPCKHMYRLAFEITDIPIPEDTIEDTPADINNGADVDSAGQTEGSILGCCSLYFKCSDAKKCLRADDPNYADCSYRKNLERGMIFYGKNASGFSDSEYELFLKEYSEMPKEVHDLLEQFIFYFLYWVRGKQQVLAYRSEILEQLQDKGYLDVKDASRYVLDNANMSQLRQYAPKKKWLKDGLVLYIVQNRPDVLEKIGKRFAFVSLPKRFVNLYEVAIRDILMQNVPVMKLVNPYPIDPIFSRPGS